jgi:long-subunit acyl-CoA synthetase (AMP-forming)
MLTHLNLIHSVLHYRTCMRLTAEDRSLLAVPASHVTASSRSRSRCSGSAGA